MVEFETITLAIMGGAIHAAIFGAKAYFDGERIDLSKTALTVVLGGLIGLLFGMTGYAPTEGEWVIILAAYTGFVAEIEAALKLLARGYAAESRERFAQAGDEAGDATGRLAGENRDRLLGGVLSRTPEVGPESYDLNDLDDSALSLGDGETPDPYPGEGDGAGFEPRGDVENGSRLSGIFSWLHETPGEETSAEKDRETIITDGP